MRVTECAGGLIVNPSLGKIVVVRNQIGKYTFPKGTCEDGETKEQTALREIREETGLAQDQLEVVSCLGILRRLGYTAAQADVPSRLKIITMFHYVTLQINLVPTESDALCAQWVSPKDLSSILTWPEELSFFEQHRAGLGIA